LCRNSWVITQLELAKELSNVSRACKLMGYSWQQFYEIRRNYQTYGSEGLLDKLPGCKVKLIPKEQRAKVA